MSERRVSTHVSATYGVGCRTCGAAADEACRTLTTGRVTDTHRARLVDAWRR